MLVTPLLFRLVSLAVLLNVFALVAYILTFVVLERVQHVLQE